MRDDEISPISQRYGRVRIPASLKILRLTFLSNISCVFNCDDHLLYVYVIVLFFVLRFFFLLHALVMAVLLSLFQTRDWKKPNFYPWSSVDTIWFPKCKFFTASENLWGHIMCTRFLTSKELLAKYLKLNKPRTQLASSLFDAASQLGFHTVFTRWRATIY